jgi:ribosomal protein S18 acetylase RimI-like enzyme
MDIRPFEHADEAAVIALWQACNLTRPWNDPHKDIQRKLQVRPDLFLVGVKEGMVVATLMAGYDGHRGWINYLAVDPSNRRRGFGRAIMAEAERRLRESGCPKINLQVRTSNEEAVAFYRGIGYNLDDVVSFGKRLEEDGPGYP